MKKTSQENTEMGKRLKALRLRKNATVDETAAAIEVAPSTLREWEKGRAISGLPYMKMAAFFNVGLYELFGIENSRNIIEEELQKLEDGIRRIYSCL